MSAHRPADSENLRGTIEAQVGQRVPGLAIVAVNADEVLLCKASGAAKLSPSVEMGPDTICNWFSMTKLVTATAAVQLAEEGQLDLDAPVSRYYEPFEMTRPDARSSAVTIRHLLSHSSGLANPVPLRWVHGATERGPDRREFVERLVEKHPRLRFDPGTTASYSNLGYLVLGEIIESVSGDRFENHIRQRILDPLGMDRTGFTADRVDEWATPHQLRLSALG
ncbi:MAG: beta-lactamase family protein, partial [Acidimicrobiia bacterium]|nr:beta-lactamase family protein [Acidimicrobiia bacterium]